MVQCYGFGNNLTQSIQYESGCSCNRIFPICTYTLLLAIVSLMYLPNIGETFAQSMPNDETNLMFKVTVNVTNNAKVSHVGTIHVTIDGTNQSKVINNVQFPSNQTVTHDFEFGALYVPVGKGFTAEVVYGNDVFKRTYGVNTPSSNPEIAKITIE